MNAEPSYTFDLTSSHTIRDVKWPADHRSSLLAHKACDVRIRITPQQTFSARLQEMVITRSGERVEEISMKLPDTTADAAALKAQELAAAWHLDDRKLSTWQKNAQGLDSDVFETNRNDVTPRLSLSIRHSFDDRLPWFVMFKFAWPN